MLEELYAYGITPQQATELTFAEMASFLSARRRYEIGFYKKLAQIGYSAGLVGSSALARRRPRFEDLFSFPKDDEPINNVELMKARMLVWAQNTNRLDRKRKMKEDNANG